MLEEGLRSTGFLVSLVSALVDRAMDDEHLHTTEHGYSEDSKRQPLVERKTMEYVLGMRFFTQPSTVLKISKHRGKT